VYSEYFEIVWNTINTKFYDPSFEGIEWDKISEEYKPIMSDLNSDSLFYDQINRMLFELRISHTGVIPPSYWSVVEPTTFAEGSTGIDVRLINSQAVITDVIKNSSADLAGIKTSYVITNINGKSVKVITNERLSLLEPPFNKTHSITAEIQCNLYGNVGSMVEIKYLDNEGLERTQIIERIKRNEIVSFGEGFPSSVIEFDARLIDEKIGYIRFNWFYPSLSKDFEKVLQNFKNTKGLIIDLRGNPDGGRQDAIAIAEMFVDEQTFAYTEQLRTGKNKIFLNPVPHPFRGEVLILVDIMSKSSSEWLAGCLQSINRGLIIGEQTPGSVGPADFKILPNGATFFYPYAKTVLADGKVIEGIGITPDIQCDIDLNDLADGKDTQLERAVNYLIKSIGEKNG
jgi:C-terminal peptidase prc